MSNIPDETPHWDNPSDGEDIARDLRQQIEAVKVRMRNMRDGIAATGNAPSNDDASDRSA